MELGARDTMLTVGSSVLFLAGIALVLLVRDSMATIAGILLIAVGTIVFIVDAKDLLVKTDQNAAD